MSPARLRADRVNYQVLIQSVRIGLYCVVVLLLAFSSIVERNFLSWNLTLVFYGFSGLGALLNILPLFSLEKFFNRPFLVFTSFVIDILLTTGLVIFSQLNQALFLFLYMILIILSGLVFKSRGAYLVAALTSIAYTVGSWFGPEIKALSFLFLMILNNIFFFVVAFLSGFLSDQLSIFAEKIELQNLSLRVIRKINEMIVETIPLGLLSVNQQGDVIQSNPGAESIFGAEGLQGQSLIEKIPELKKKNLRLEQLDSKIEFDLPWNVSDSESRLLKFQILPQSLEFSEKTFLVIVEDLTEKQRLEFAVRQSEKLAAVGGLAAGIAHEIRNPLAGISGSIELLSQNFQNEDDKKLGKIILKEIDRLNRLISEFLDFAKPDQPPTEKVDLSSIVEDVLKQSALSTTIQFKLEKKMLSPAFILGNADKLKQAFLNIVINSIQAMDKSAEPRLTVSIDRVQENREDIVLLRIKDTGCGMKAETRKRMFEPFHTTKPKGTGLGLAITHKILQSHSAKIFVESEVGLGTEFLISFPGKKD